MRITFTAMGVNSGSCGHDHRTLNAAVRCATTKSAVSVSASIPTGASTSVRRSIGRAALQAFSSSSATWGPSMRPGLLHTRWMPTVLLFTPAMRRAGSGSTAEAASVDENRARRRAVALDRVKKNRPRQGGWREGSAVRSCCDDCLAPSHGLDGLGARERTAGGKSGYAHCVS